MKKLSKLEIGITAAVFTALSFSAALAVQHKMKKMEHGNMNHGKTEREKMNMGSPKATSIKVGDLQLSGAWARQSFGKAVNSAGFLSINNMGKADDILVGASSTISKRTELHTHIKDGDVMRMRRVKGGIKVPKGGSAELKPGGLHVMFIQLKEPLKKGTVFPITLKFKNAGDVTINMTAQKMALPANIDKMNHGAMDHTKMPRGSN